MVKKINFTIEEMEICFSALSFMFADYSAREEYKGLLLDNKIEFPTKDLDIISDILTSYMGEDDILQDYNVAQELTKLKRYSDLTSSSLEGISRINFKAFMDRIKSNIDVLKDIPVITYGDNKQSFLSYVNGNLRALINSKDKKKWGRWNSRAWELLTDEETYIYYGNFIKQCNFELRKNDGIFDQKDYSEMCKKVAKWDSDRNTKEALNKVRRTESHIIDLNQYDSNQNIICSKDGTIISLKTGEIKKANRDDMILFTSKYNFMKKEDSTKFMNEKLCLYKEVLGQERLSFLLDLIAYKMLGKSLQKAIFLIGNGGTGKSLFKNIVKDLFEGNVQTMAYEYLTVNHKGKDDKSVDDYLVLLDGKLWGLLSEGDGDHPINQARFKNILSGASDSARKTGLTVVDTDLERLDLLIDTNQVPKFTNVNYAISRRLLFVNFVNKIPIDKVNADYYSDEIRPNFDYVFSYFVYRAIGLINKKLIIPEIIISDTKKNINEFDSVARFAAERIAPMPGSYVKFSEIEKEYADLCNSNDMPNIIPSIDDEGPRCTAFIKAVIEKDGYEKIYKQRAAGRSIRPYRIYGIILIDTDDTNVFEEEEPKTIQQTINIEPKPTSSIVDRLIPEPTVTWNTSNSI